EGQLSMHGGRGKRLLRYPRPYVVPGAPFDRWEVVEVPGALPDEASDSGWTTLAHVEHESYHRNNRRMIVDLIDAIEHDREQAASGQRGRAASEMVEAVAAAHAAGGRVALPLADRRHPYAAAHPVSAVSR